MNQVDRDIANLPDTTASVKTLFGFDTKMVVPAYSKTSEHVPDLDPDYLFDKADHAGDPGRFRLQPPRYGDGLSRHGQIHPYRTGGGAPELALRARQPRQPHQPYRLDRQGRHRAQDGKQVTEFRDGILPWAYQHNVALVLRRI
jgi:cobaltochelatase CobS